MDKKNEKIKTLTKCKRIFSIALLSILGIVSHSSALSHTIIPTKYTTKSESSQLLAQNYTYEIYLTGIACYKESKHVWGATSDEPFVVVAAVDAQGNITENIFPAPNSHLGKMDQGDMKRLNYLVWRGRVQTVQVSGQLWDYDNAHRKAVKTFADISDIAAYLGAAAISVGSGGTATVGAAAMATAINKFNDKTRKSLEGALHDHLGTGKVTAELNRAGTLADAPQQTMGPIKYDFYTTHKGDGGHYKLFWEVRRY